LVGWLVSSQFSPLHECYMSRPSDLLCFDYPNIFCVVYILTKKSNDTPLDEDHNCAHWRQTLHRWATRIITRDARAVT